MILLTSNKTRQLLVITFINQVTPADFTAVAAEFVGLVTDLQRGFTLLVDLTPMHSMSEDCAPEISNIMDLCDQHGVQRIIRVIPDPAKDIGFTILSRFHYPTKPRMISSATLSEAVRHLAA